MLSIHSILYWNQCIVLMLITMTVYSKNNYMYTILFSVNNTTTFIASGAVFGVLLILALLVIIITVVVFFSRRNHKDRVSRGKNAWIIPAVISCVYSLINNKYSWLQYCSSDTWSLIIILSTKLLTTITSVRALYYTHLSNKFNSSIMTKFLRKKTTTTVNCWQVLISK